MAVTNEYLAAQAQNTAIGIAGLQHATNGQQQIVNPREPSLRETIDRLAKINADAIARAEHAEKLADELCGQPKEACGSIGGEPVSASGLIDNLRREIDRTAAAGVRLTAALSRIERRLSA